MDGRWTFTPEASGLWDLLRRTGRAAELYRAWIETQIAALVPLPVEEEQQLIEAYTPPHQAQLAEDRAYAATWPRRLALFKQASFTLLVEERFSRTKRQRDQLIYSLLRCKSRSRIEELALAIREGELDFAQAAIRWSEGPESASGGRVGPIAPGVSHPDLNQRLEVANEGQLIGPFRIGDTHVLLRLDTRITTRLDDGLQAQIIDELYAEWLEAQVSALMGGESIEPIEYLPAA